MLLFTIPVISQHNQITPKTAEDTSLRQDNQWILTWQRCNSSYRLQSINHPFLISIWVESCGTLFGKTTSFKSFHWFLCIYWNKTSSSYHLHSSNPDTWLVIFKNPQAFNINGKQVETCETTLQTINFNSYHWFLCIFETEQTLNIINTQAIQDFKMKLYFQKNVIRIERSFNAYTTKMTFALSLVTSLTTLFSQWTKKRLTYLHWMILSLTRATNVRSLFFGSSYL